MSTENVTRVVVFYRDDNGMQRYVEYPPTCVVLLQEEAAWLRQHTTWIPSKLEDAEERYRNLLGNE